MIVKKNKYFFLFLVVILSGAKNLIRAQDAHFTQFYSAPLQLNPALAGSWAGGRASNTDRYQWFKLYGTYQSHNMSYDQYVRFLRGGLGINYVNDNQADGTFILNRFDATYSPYIPLFKDSSGKGKIVIQPAVSFCYGIKKLDWSKLSFGDMIDPGRGYVYTSQEQINVTQRHYVCFNFGFLAYSKRFMGGYAVYNIYEPDEGYLGGSKLPMRYVLHLSGILGSISDSTKHLNIIPSFMYMTQQDFRNGIFMVNTKYDKYSFGIGYRFEDAVLFSAGFEIKFFKLSYSYDLTVSDLKGYTSGTHEANMSFRFLDKKWKKKLLNLQNYNF